MKSRHDLTLCLTHSKSELHLPVSFDIALTTPYSGANGHVVHNSSVLRKYESPQDRLSTWRRPST
ncbi:hypothetical protein M378DRAFT_952103 [Amanita muscaria Koide BX008]|uniref:Uncharacterized protein n=1 Tax=Amanita muscaria (strain Koide BX008) TaxID=946122 RepID=A0A0C2T123_AMAMK|nr:hypothetical protein M378DRAFT_952103 [Amanita muscaria Koide BX008]